jgi:hypothetical protein
MMATIEERVKILQMVQDGKITAEEGAQLLEALEGSERVPPQPETPASPFNNVPEKLGRKPQWLRVRVTDSLTGRPRVNVRLPIGMVGIGLKMGSRFAPEMEGLDTKELMQMIEAGEIGQIVDVSDEKDGEHVEVFLE